LTRLSLARAARQFFLPSNTGKKSR
jgi:hypothetical protein